MPLEEVQNKIEEIRAGYVSAKSTVEASTEDPLDFSECDSKFEEVANKAIEYYMDAEMQTTMKNQAQATSNSLSAVLASRPEPTPATDLAVLNKRISALRAGIQKTIGSLQILETTNSLARPMINDLQTVLTTDTTMT